MQVAEVMTRDVVITTPTTSIGQVVQLMLAHHISGLPVIDAAGQICGMLSEGDLLRRAETGTAAEPSWWRTLLGGPERLARWYVHTHGRKVGEIMTRKVISVASATPLIEAVGLMQVHGVKRLPVLAPDGQLAGIVSRADVLRALDRVLSKHADGGADEAIRKSVQAELARQRWLAPACVSVTVRDGMADLHGMVFSGAEREALRVLVENVPGVRGVADHLVWVEPRTGTVVALPSEDTSPG